MIAPSMVVEVMNGTNTTCYAKAGISYIKVGPLGTANWVSSQLKYVNLKYKIMYSCKLYLGKFIDMR